ncbi:hypothetical protein H1D32_15690 [Anaerobacillus sp. CMMVII]|uniref:HIT family protein n=1 Tax=Anaerobacillus sp. CMMVII TaxID=2755588 RepID=UPI0021B79E24|nr:hypothetical protein [Anaerobacillus sp. CMMVII]MCT8139016.1 hypothetical protein [Anaerobacillus sp. CMMVII]
MTILTEFQEKYKVVEYSIYETEHWIWSVRPNQGTIGAGILSLKRECVTFSGLEQNEFSDLNNIIKIIESTLKSTLNYDVINYLMLMMIDKHVHYHVFPRYKNPVSFLDEVWKDETWPALPSLMGDTLMNDKLQEITKIIKSKVKSRSEFGNEKI